MSRRRQLSDEEQALWSGFVRSIRPLRHVKNADKPATSENLPAPKSPKAADAAPAPPQPQQAKTPPLAPFGRRLKQRVARGREPIDARIDLHGMTQVQAHTALLRFLRRSQTDGARTVLIVTGKGLGSGASEGDPAGRRGVLKRQVPMWLSLPEFRTFIVGFEDAHIGHGGEGALYVRLRRSR